MSNPYGNATFMAAIGLTKLPEIGQVAEAIEMVNIPVARPKVNEVAIGLSASAMNIDEIYAAQGTALGRFYGPKTASRKRPYVLGSSVSGTVVGLGDGVDQFSLGDEVIVIPAHYPEAGSWVEYRCVPHERVMLKPPELSHVEAAAMALAACVAWGAIECSHAAAGARCLVVGASGAVGGMVLQYLHVLGCDVTAVCSQKNADLVLSKGANNVIDYTSHNFANKAAKAGISYDCIFDCVGGRVIERDSFRVLKKSGVYVTVVGPMQYIGEQKLSWFAFLKVMGYVVMRIFSTRFGGPRYKFGAKLPIKTIESAIGNALAYKLKMPVERTIPFAIKDIREAIHLLTSHRAKGRIVIDFEMSKLHS